MSNPQLKDVRAFHIRCIEKLKSDIARDSESLKVTCIEIEAEKESLEDNEHLAHYLRTTINLSKETILYHETEIESLLSKHESDI